MMWLVLTSLRRNLAKYRLALVGIAASVAVSCLGLSGANLMHNLARHPVASVVGGDMFIADAEVEFYGSRSGVHSEGMFPTFEFDQLRALVETEIPLTRVTGSLFAPALSAESTPLGILLGRYDPIGYWLYRPSLLEGSFPDLAGGRDDSLAVSGRRGNPRNRAPGDTITVRVPRREATPSGDVWDFASGILQDYNIAGIYDGIFNSGYLWTSLATVQEHLGAGGQVAWAE
jgi:hypothetical protein